jgi:hypothetical protein
MKVVILSEASRSFIVQYQDILYMLLSGHPLQVVEIDLGE